MRGSPPALLNQALRKHPPHTWRPSACSRTWIPINFNHVFENQRPRPKEFKFKIREVTLNLRFTYRCLVECTNALQD